MPFTGLVRYYILGKPKQYQGIPWATNIFSIPRHSTTRRYVDYILLVFTQIIMPNVPPIKNVLPLE